MRGLPAMARHTPAVRATWSVVCLCALLVGALCAGGEARAQDESGGVLAECTARSPRLDDLHGCLDDYLGVMDERLSDVQSYVERTLAPDARVAFDESRLAFAAYRRSNCLWYLAFSKPRTEAELIAKDCLATMSIQRLSELQRLIAAGDGEAVQSGHYVYGANRNTFRPCGSDTRYWVEAEPSVLGELQQTYLDIADEDLQVLYARLRGTLDEEAQTADGHQGVLRASALVELRVPREGDCRLPAGTPPVIADAPAAGLPAATPAGETPAEVADAPADEEPEEELIAYFGAWNADCVARGGSRTCRLATALGEANELALTRDAAGRTTVELRFPDREIDSPTKIRWSVDGFAFGDIVGSNIRVDAEATRQIVDERRFVDEELLPRMIEGNGLAVEVLDSIDAEDGERFAATLIGLTRALAFADDFARDGGAL